jgi:hypothetical protein
MNPVIGTLVGRYCTSKGQVLPGSSRQEKKCGVSEGAQVPFLQTTCVVKTNGRIAHLFEDVKSLRVPKRRMDVQNLHPTYVEIPEHKVA